MCEYAVASVRHVTIGQITADDGRIGSIGAKRSAIQSAACDGNLVKGFIRILDQLFSTGLSAVIRFMCQTMVKDIIVLSYLFDASMRRSGRFLISLTFIYITTTFFHNKLCFYR